MEGARLELGDEAQPSCRTSLHQGVKGRFGVRMLQDPWPPWHLAAGLECCQYRWMWVLQVSQLNLDDPGHSGLRG